MGEGTATRAKVRRRRIIERPRLTRLLDESQGRIKMLVAPAGYGKTTLARQWLVGKPAAWYTATPAAADVAALAAGLSEAVSQIVPGAGDALLERIGVTDRPDDEADVLSNMLASDLSAWPEEAWLVIDDYHAFVGHSGAEHFVHQMLLDAPLQALVLSRRRPAWASTRRILYGEVVEVDRLNLAMTMDEAVVLFGGAEPGIPDVLAVTQGWPAVVALAAASNAPTAELMAAPNLVSYLAEEIFQALDRPTQKTLCELALYEAHGLQAALRTIGGPGETKRIVSDLGANGFLTEPSAGKFEMHPLLREFLEFKLREEPGAEVARTVGRAVHLLFGLQLWDEAYEIIQRFNEATLLTELIARSADHLLAQGRTSTLRSWVAGADAAEPAVRRAMAQLALREGLYLQAETLAVLAAQATRDSALRARSLVVAARAAHVASRQEKALEYYGQAATISPDAELGWQAKLGELQAAAELEAIDAPQKLDELAAAVPDDPTARVVFADRTLGIQTRYAVPVSLEIGRGASQLLSLVPDPLVRTSFRNIFGYALAASAMYGEAMVLMDDQLDDAGRCRVDFAVPYALVTKALVHTGQRDYGSALELLEKARRQASDAGDHTAVSVGAAVHARALIAQADFEQAAHVVRGFSPEIPLSLKAELTACQALALAGAGHHDKAIELAEEALRSVGVEATICARSAKAAVAIYKSDYAAALRETKTALRIATYTGLVEAFVSAYRGFPQLVVCLCEDKETHADLAHVLRLVGDAEVMPDSGLDRATHSILQLSPREKEVLALLGRGLTNRQIGQSLFISPVTVKVHVRHIFEKLGVRSRAEAALRAAQLGRD